MFTDGKIKTYDSERGMGTLELIGEAQELSFKLQDLPSPEIEPQIGERLKFRIIPQQESPERSPTTSTRAPMNLRT